MRCTFALCILGLALNYADAQAKLQSFTSDDRAFSFQYLNILVHCKQKPSQPDWWLPSDSCNAYGPVCDDTGTGSNVLACFAYPKTTYKNTNFQSAAFSVAKIKSARTRDECLTGPPNGRSVGTTTINGASFTLFALDGAGLGNELEGWLYKSFYQNACYALSVRMGLSDPAAYEPGTVKLFTAEDRQEVLNILKQAVDSFRFLK